MSITTLHQTIDTETGQILDAKASTRELDNPRFSPYREWYQFNKEHTESMIWLVQKSSSAYQILLFLLDQMDNYNAVVCSYKVMQEALGMSQVTVARGIKILKEHGFVQVLKSGTCNVYTVNKRIAWSSWGTNYKYCKFEANVVISRSEQQEDMEDVPELPKLDSVTSRKQKVLNTKEAH